MYIAYSPSGEERVFISHAMKNQPRVDHVCVCLCALSRWLLLLQWLRQSYFLPLNNILLIYLFARNTIIPNIP